MVTSIKRWTSIAGIFAFLLSVVAAFAFTPAKVAVEERSVVDYVWIKYDCSNNLQPQYIQGQANFQLDDHTDALFSSCEGVSLTVCAVRFAIEDTELITSGVFAGNRMPLVAPPTGAENRIYCSFP